MTSTKRTRKVSKLTKAGAGPKGQLLISRFFGAKPKSATTQPTASSPPLAPPADHIPSPRAPQSATADASPKQRTPAKRPQHVEQKSAAQEVTARSDPEAGDTPATNVLSSPTPCDEAALSSQSTEPLRGAGKGGGEGAQEGPRKRRRLFLSADEDEDDLSVDSEPETRAAKSRKDSAADPDFAVGEDGEVDEAEDDASDYDVVEEEETENEDEEREYSQDEDGITPARRRNVKGGMTLASFELDRSAGAAEVLPRDAKRRKKFTQKIGRLEKNSFFLRRTGGGGDLEEAVEGAGRRGAKTTKYTPLETQFLKMRKQNPGMLLVVECGYKFRLFDEDALVASKVLRVAAFFDHNFMTASFPTHRLSHHVQRLVQAGHKVGVVTQSETAALKKASDKSSKLFERKLSAIYTKGTITADGKLCGSEHNSGTRAGSSSATYIMAVLEVEREGTAEKLEHQAQTIAVAAVDSATGEVLFDSFDDDVLRSDLESRLVALEPVEILMSKKTSSKATELAIKAFSENMGTRLERVNSTNFDRSDMLAKLNDTITEHYGKEKGTVQAILSCLGALAEYLKQFGLELSMTNALEFKSFRSNRHMLIGADVLRNFEVFGNSNDGAIEGSLIGLVNRTKTPFGSRQMRQWLSHPLVNPTDIADRLDSVEYLRNKVDGIEGQSDVSDPLAAAVAEFVSGLAGLPDLEQGLTRITCHKCTPAEFLAVIRAFEGIGRIIDHLKTIQNVSSLPPLLCKMFATTPVVGTVLNSAVVETLSRDAAADNRYHELFSLDRPLSDLFSKDDSAEEFVRVAEELQAANGELQACERAMVMLLKKLRQKHSFSGWEWKKVANEEYLLEVPVSKASSMPHSWPIVCQTKALKRFRPPEASTGYEKVLCARETRDEIASRCWKSYLELFVLAASPLRAVVRTLLDLDCLAALARVSNLPGYSKPSVETSQAVPAGLMAEEARHPLTEALQTCSSYVPNDVRLGRGMDELALVISGPNYGGKSSYTRMTALLVILAQVGSYVPARTSRLSPFNSIYARMGSTDAIGKGMSSLMVELAETSRILGSATSRSLVVLDELGRGTSTHDGTAVAYATLAHLVANVQCVTLFVTHYPTLATLQSTYPKEIGAFYMDYLEEEESGPSDNRSPAIKTEISSAKTNARTKITFLYKLARGVAASSYGLNVARLAGIPNEVIENAGVKACQLESRLASTRAQHAMASLLKEATWGDEDNAITALKLASSLTEEFPGK